LQALVRQAPGYAPGEGALGSALLQAGRPDEAQTHLSRALSLNPRLADVRFNLALLLGAESRHGETIALLRQGLRLEPSNPSFQQLLAWELATAPEADLRDGAEAVRLARSALARSPQDPVYQYTLAAALAETGDFKGALNAAEQAEAEAVRLGRAGQAATIRAAIARLQKGQPLHAGTP
ncbi:MAG: tetratricopeptide repeat protein, partial [Gemmatimonadota bacterium]